jgi:hypothetical protein
MQTTTRITRYFPPVFKTRRFKPDKLIRKHDLSLLFFCGQEFIKQPTAAIQAASLAVSQSQLHGNYCYYSLLVLLVVLHALFLIDLNIKNRHFLLSISSHSLLLAS